MTLQKQSYIYSSLFHIIILVILFFSFQQTNNILESEIIEFIIFETFEPVILQNPVTTRPPAVVDRFTDQPAASESSQNLTDINIPDLEFPDFDPVDISQLPTRSDIDSRGTYGTAIRDSLMQANLNNRNVIETPIGHENNTITPSSNIGSEGLAEEIREQTGAISQFLIEGEVRNRTVITQPLPIFPENIMRNVTITMEFTVVPNGTVQNIRVTRRGDPEFERVSIEALRQWIFVRSDRSHTGRVTFNFILQ